MEKGWGKRERDGGMEGREEEMEGEGKVEMQIYCT